MAETNFSHLIPVLCHCEYVVCCKWSRKLQRSFDLVYKFAEAFLASYLTPDWPHSISPSTFFFFFCHLSCSFMLLSNVWFTNTIITLSSCNIVHGCLTRTKDNFSLAGSCSLNITKILLHQSFTDNWWHY